MFEGKMLLRFWFVSFVVVIYQTRKVSLHPLRLLCALCVLNGVQEVGRKGRKVSAKNAKIFLVATECCTKNRKYKSATQRMLMATLLLGP